MLRLEVSEIIYINYIQSPGDNTNDKMFMNFNNRNKVGQYLLNKQKNILELTISNSLQKLGLVRTEDPHQVELLNVTVRL